MVRVPSRGLTTPIALAVIFSAIFAVRASAAPVTVTWDPSPDDTVIGYQVYVGTSPGSYTETFDVGLARTFTYSPPDASVHYFAVAAYAQGPLLGPLSSEVSTVSGDAPNPGNQAANYWSSLWAERAQTMRTGRVENLTSTEMQRLADARGPALTISVPTSRRSYTTDQPFVALGGTVTDDRVLTEVTWTTDRGYKGRATGTENWIAGVPLRLGANTITVRARDDAGRLSSQVIVVTLARDRSMPLALFSR